MLSLEKSPYTLSPQSEAQIINSIKEIEGRVSILRKSGKLTDETLKRYYGLKRFEQVAESNAIEGSTLSIGETEVAVLRGITLTGHDPAYVRDARALDSALTRIVEIAKERKPTDIEQLLEIHSLILGDRLGGGKFRSEPVRISGSEHTPPKTWQAIMAAMEQWEGWSVANSTSPAPLRAAVLHAWLAHIHPFIDGNGRTARAISNLELVRAGYPPVIIRKKERDRYIDALSQSDSAGDIASFLDLVLERTVGAIDGLERAASEKQGFDPIVARIRQKQSLQLEVWRKSVELLSSLIELKLSEKLSHPSIQFFKRDFGGVADLDDFLTLCQSKPVGSSWSFRLSINIRGIARFSFLSYVGHRSHQMLDHLGGEGGPALYWSVYDASLERKWRSVTTEAPYFREATISLDRGNDWSIITARQEFVKCTTVELAESVSNEILRKVEEGISSQ